MISQKIGKPNSLLGRQYMYVQPHLGLKRTQIDAHLTKSFYSRGFKIV
jgi:hypothetical protein